MNRSFTRVITLCMLLSLVASTPTFTGAFISGGASTPAGTVTAGSQGNLITLTTAGWIVSDAIATSSLPDITYFTVVAYTGNVGVGLAASDTAVSGCTSTTARTYTATPVGTAASGSQCPADFLTAYVSIPGTSTTTGTTGTLPTLAAGTSYKYTLNAATGSSGCDGLVYSSGTGAAAAAATATSTTVQAASSTCTTSSTNSGTYAKGTFAYDYYVQTIATSGVSTPTATVCFQTATQFTASPGVCNPASTKSAGVLSAVGAIVATVLLFLN